MADLIATTETDEQQALREATRRFLVHHASSARVRQAMADPAGYDADTWKRLADELGLVGLAVPDELGGSGASLAEVAVVVNEIGRTLLPAPYLSTALAAALIATTAEHDPGLTELLTNLASGVQTAAVAFAGGNEIAVSAAGRLTGRLRTVMDAPAAGLIVVGTPGRLFAVERAAVEIVPVPAMDPTRRQGDVTLVEAPARELSTTWLGAHAEDVVRALLAVEAVGAAERALEITVDYLKTRVQFGRVIGSFQALKHRCADLAVGVASAKATAAAAMHAAVSGDDELAVLGPLAKLYCTDVFMRVAGEMIQLHGGIGFTWEHDAHLYFKRAKSTQLQFGTPDVLRTLIGQRADLFAR